MLALLAGGGYLATRDGGSQQASTPTVQVKGEVLREPVTVPGPDAFTIPVVSPSTVSVPTTASPTTVAPSAPPTTGAVITIATTSGGTPGLYGGTLNNADCNKEQLIAFLEQNPDKGRAWASVQGIEPARLREFIGQLTPMVLEADTRVTNHGFANGQATPRQSVLQKGTAVLVDRNGEPRARCYCGNPLVAPQAQAGATTFNGPTWQAFDPGNMQAVSPSPSPIATFTLRDTATGQGIARPAGSDGSSDKPAPAPPPLAEPSRRPPPTVVASTVPPTATTTLPATTSVPRTTVATSITGRIPAPNAFVQKEGALVASSTYPGFLTSWAVDGDVTTSWFSAGSQVDGPRTTFEWTGLREDLITHVKIVGNAANRTPDFRRNFGFGQVIVQVLDASGQVDFEQTVSLPGTPDPDVVVQPGVRGVRVRLILSGGEAPDCGGFAELEVGVTR